MVGAFFFIRHLLTNKLFAIHSIFFKSIRSTCIQKRTSLWNLSFYNGYDNWSMACLGFMLLLFWKFI